MAHPPQPRPNPPPGGQLESQHPCWVSRSLSLRATCGWSRSHTRKPILGKSMDSEIINQRVSAHSDSHQWLLIHICQIPIHATHREASLGQLHKEIELEYNFEGK